MPTSFRRADPATESTDLDLMLHDIVPHEPRFGPGIWQDPSVESYWIYISGVKAGLIAFQLNADVADDYDSDSVEALGSAYLLFIGFRPGWQRKGYGISAIQWLLITLRDRGGIDQVVSNIRPSNLPSHKLHLLAEFTPSEIKPKYYRNPIEDSLVMRRNLNI